MGARSIQINSFYDFTRNGLIHQGNIYMIIVLMSNAIIKKLVQKNFYQEKLITNIDSLSIIQKNLQRSKSVMLQQIERGKKVSRTAKYRGQKTFTLLQCSDFILMILHYFCSLVYAHLNFFIFLYTVFTALILSVLDTTTHNF